MRKELKKLTVKCASCKTEHVFLSTADSAYIEICSGCHPFYTGKEILVDTDNRLQNFSEKLTKKVDNLQSKRERLLAKKANKTSSSTGESKLSLKDMLASIK